MNNYGKTFTEDTDSASWDLYYIYEYYSKGKMS